MLLFILRLGACSVLGGVLGLGLLLVLLFCGAGAVLPVFIATGKPLALMSLQLLPEVFWHSFTGMANAQQHPALLSLLQLCMALGQVGVLLGGLFYWRWYWR